MKLNFRLWTVYILKLSLATGVIAVQTSHSQEYTIHTGESDVMKYILKMPDYDDVYGIASSPGGNEFAITTGKNIYITDFETGRLKRIIEFDYRHYRSAVRGIAYSPDGSLIAAATTFAGIHIYSPASGELITILGGPDSAIPEEHDIHGATGVGFFPDGNRIVSIDHDDSRFVIWSLEEGKIEDIVEANMLEGIERFALSPDGRYITLSNYEYVAVFDLPSREKIWGDGRHFRGLEKVLDYSPDGRYLAVGTGGPGAGSEIVDAENIENTVVYMPPAGDRSLGGIRWLDDGKHLVSATIGSGIAPVMFYKLNDDVSRAEYIILDRQFEAQVDCLNAVAVGVNGTRAAVIGSREVRVYRLPVR